MASAKLNRKKQRGEEARAKRLQRLTQRCQVAGQNESRLVSVQLRLGAQKLLGKGEITQAEWNYVRQVAKELQDAAAKAVTP